MKHWQKQVRDYADSGTGNAIQGHRFVGVDPGTKGTGVASILTNRGLICSIELTYCEGHGSNDDVRMSLNLQQALVETVGVSLVLVEDQTIRESGKAKTKNPASLLPLAHVAGCAFHQAAVSLDLPAYVKPNEWKGSQSKLVNHKRTCDELDLAYETMKGGYCALRIGECEDVSARRLGLNGREQAVRKSDYKELLDALGIAWFALKRHRMEAKKIKLLKSRGHLN